MFQTHYARQRPKQRWDEDKGPLLTQLESVLYSAAPTELLFVKDVLYQEFRKILAKDKDLPSDRRLFDTALEGLCKKGFVKEVNGVRLQKWLETF